MNNTINDIQFKSFLAQLEPDIDIPGKAVSTPEGTMPDGTAKNPISIETQTPIPTKTVFNPVEYLVQIGTTTGTIVLLIVVGATWFENHFGKDVRAWLVSIAAVNKARAEEHSQRIKDSAEIVEQNARNLKRMVEVLESIEDSQRGIEQAVTSIRCANFKSQTE